MKFIFFALTSEEQNTKSPSFSLFSSSTKIYILPFLASSIISSIEDKSFKRIRLEKVDSVWPAFKKLFGGQKNV